MCDIPCNVMEKKKKFSLHKSFPHPLLIFFLSDCCVPGQIAVLLWSNGAGPSGSGIQGRALVSSTTKWPGSCGAVIIQSSRLPLTFIWQPLQSPSPLKHCVITPLDYLTRFILTKKRVYG